MPLGMSDPQFDIEDLPQQMAQTPIPESARIASSIGGAVTRSTDMVGKWLGPDTLAASSGYGSFGASLVGGAPMLASPIQQPRMLDPETANATYGWSGQRWNKPVSEDDAAWSASVAAETTARQDIASKTQPNLLLDIGSNLVGSLFDPVGGSIMLATGGLGEAALGAIGWKAAAAEASGGLSVAGRVANLARYPAAGLIENAPYVAANAALTDLSGGDYTAMDGLTDLATGATVHTVIHAGVSALKRVLKDPKADPLSDAPASTEAAPADVQGPGTAEIAPGEGAKPPPVEALGPTTDFVPAGGVPDAVDQLPPASRRAAFLLAMEQTSRGEDVNVDGLIDKEREIPERPAVTDLDPPPPDVTMPSWRPTGEPPALAVSPEGTATPAATGLVEAHDLVTSHNDDGSVNSEYPAELQPRAGGDILTHPLVADGGPPIVSPSGVVEAGNGEVIAARQVMAEGGEAADAYRAGLEAQGHDTSGMKAPVLVRARSQPLTDAQRAALSHEWTGPAHETQAGADAARIDDEGLSKLDGTPAGGRAFDQDFRARVAGGAADRGRIDAAVMVKAYGDERLVADLLANPKLKALGEALRAAAPAWAQMRAAIARGEAQAGLDLTTSVTSAAELVQAAHAGGVDAGELIATLLGQKDVFTDGGGLIGPGTEAVLRLMFREAKEGEGAASFQRPRAAAKIAAVLKEYAAQVQKAGRSEVLGGIPRESEGAQILGDLRRRLATGDFGDYDILRPPGRTDGDTAPEAGGGASANEPRPAVLGDGQGGEGGQQPGRPGAGEAGGPGEGEGPGAEPGAEPAAGERGAAGGAAVEGEEGTEPAPTGDQVIAENPELKKLDTDTSNLAGALGVTPEVDPKDDPNIIAKTVAAATQCLLDNIGEIF